MCVSYLCFGIFYLCLCVVVVVVVVVVVSDEREVVHVYKDNSTVISLYECHFAQLVPCEITYIEAL